MTDIRAEIRLATQELRDDLPFYTKDAGDAAGHDLSRRQSRGGGAVGPRAAPAHRKGRAEAPGTLRILTDDPDGFAGGQRLLTAPNGTRVEIDELNPPLVLPATEHAFVVRRLADQAPWIIGRAGMQYRDLVPSRLGGR
jgi:hypothetical protein